MTPVTRKGLCCATTSYHPDRHPRCGRTHRGDPGPRPPAAAAAGPEIYPYSSVTNPLDPSLTAFYTPPSTLPTANGTLMRVQRYAAHTLTVLGSYSGTAYRVMYKSTDNLGNPIAVTGTVLVPTNPYLGQGPRPVVAYDTGTVGLAAKCAPSRANTDGSWDEATFANTALQKGWVLAVTDYQGLGTVGGVHSYLVRKPAAYATLDMIRAAKQLPEAGLTATSPVGVMGYSQGGGAAAATAELAASYAPELPIKGVAAGAVPADLTAVANFLDGSFYANNLWYALSGLMSANNVDPAQFLNAAGLDRLAHTRTTCGNDGILYGAYVKTRDYTTNGQPVSSYYGVAPWTTILPANKIGNVKPTMPVFLGHSAFDDVIPYSVGTALKQSWCAKGARVTFTTYVSPTHVATAAFSYPDQMTWLQARFNGQTQLTHC